MHCLKWVDNTEEICNHFSWYIKLFVFLNPIPIAIGTIGNELRFIEVNHWLEDIESREGKRRRSARDSARIQDKMFRIEQNFAKNKERYNGFIATVDNLVGRVNELPLEYREIFGKLKSQAKQTRLDNKLHIFSGSKRTQRSEYKTLMKPFKPIHYKHVRIIYFNIAKIMDQVEVEIREELLEKKRRDGQMIPESSDPKFEGKKPSGQQKDKFHMIYYYDMDKLTEDFALRIIDWLVFREDLHHLPVIREGEPRFKPKED